MISVIATDERSPGGVAVDVDRWQTLAAAVLADALADQPEGLHAAPGIESETGELNLLFVDLAEMSELNVAHMGGDGPTDVLSFPLDDLLESFGPEQERLFGDVVISPEIAASNASDHTGTADDEFALLVVHGVLHILGFDHAEPADAALMHAAERRLLDRFYGPVTIPEHAGPEPAGGSA